MHNICFGVFLLLLPSSALRLPENPSDSCTGPSPRPNDYSYFSKISATEKSGCKIDISVSYFNVATADAPTNARGYNFVLLSKTKNSDTWHTQFNETVPGTATTATPTAELKWNPGIIQVNDSTTTFRAMMIRKNTAATSVSAGDSIPRNISCAGPTTGTQGSLDRAYDSLTARYTAPLACTTSFNWLLLLFILFIGGGGGLLTLFVGTTILTFLNKRRGKEPSVPIQFTIG